MTAKYGTPYFSNYINSDMEPSDIRSMCCRLRLDLRELRKKGGGFFGSGESTGSIGVVTINMPRIAYLAKDEAEFYDRLNKLMDIAARSLDTKRTVVTKLMNAGLYPYTKRYLGTFENHFSTIGLIGMNEVGLNAKWLGKGMLDEKTRKFTKEVLNHMRDRLVIYQEKYGALFNLEATPAESTTYRLAKHDVERYPDIITAAKHGDTPYYTNSSHLPVGATDDLFEALDLQDGLQVLYTSGTVFHAFLGEKLPDWKAAATLVRKIAENYKLPYYTLSPTYSVCSTHGYIAGEHHTCPECGKGTEVYSRITGYYRPVKNWNAGKSQEFKDRKEYNPAEIISISDAHSSSGKKKASSSEIMLFTTKTCANCTSAKKVLDEAGIKYRVMDAAEHQDLVEKYGIMQAPTLVCVTGNDAVKYAGLQSVMQFLKEAK
jgi:anaerobic ribonucleoside-triphosphate reductase